MATILAVDRTMAEPQIQGVQAQGEHVQDAMVKEEVQTKLHIPLTIQVRAIPSTALHAEGQPLHILITGHYVEPVTDEAM